MSPNKRRTSPILPCPLCGKMLHQKPQVLKAHAAKHERAARGIVARRPINYHKY